jgi:hypothetical protein
MGCSPHADMPNNYENNASHESSCHGWVHVNIQESTNQLTTFYMFVFVVPLTHIKCIENMSNLSKPFWSLHILVQVIMSL